MTYQIGHSRIFCIALRTFCTSSTRSAHKSISSCYNELEHISLNVCFKMFIKKQLNFIVILNKRNLQLKCFRITATIGLMTNAFVKTLNCFIASNHLLLVFPFLQARKRYSGVTDWVSGGCLGFLQMSWLFSLA